MKNVQSLIAEASDEERAILYYHVEERINMNFGSSITTYDVSNLSLISDRNLGENNTRTITPKYGKAKAKAVAVNLKPQSEIVAPTEKPKALTEIIRPVSLQPEKKLKYAEIDLIGTYERVLDKGYQSVDLLKRVGNNRFFVGDLEKAAKYYSQLFSLTTDLEAEYYYRYSQALFSIQETEKAKEMLHMYENMAL
ncbi:hypothetical protein G4D82_09840 [Flavobacterium sp. CYK-4]|uniref:hypothetical protein n=1 Tax=Flavobacterium lotistagni TaxID=2709660 RepID=UPI00140C1ED1|nr:hypothetical protein [Flavobacterium lotistagni]NHM07521.1 hypothetical protein [Flavobacterium lotistagni]